MMILLLLVIVVFVSCVARAKRQWDGPVVYRRRFIVASMRERYHSILASLLRAATLTLH